MTAVLPEAAAGADDALELLYRDHAKDVSRYALAVLGDRTDAEDVTQTTFLNAYRALQRGERPLKPAHWLIHIAHNACLERFRHGQRRPCEVVFVDEASAAPVRDDDGPTVGDLRNALLQLPDSQRAALVMRELEGRPYVEIADALEISVGAVETLLFRARRALREQLEEQLPCGDAIIAIARQADGQLPRRERARLRAHLRGCSECSRSARSRRARPTVLGGFIPVPPWLSSLFGSGGAGAGALVAKVASVVVAGAVVGGGIAEGARHLGRQPRIHPAGDPAVIDRAQDSAIVARPRRPVRVGDERRSPLLPLHRRSTAPTQATAPTPQFVITASPPVAAAPNGPRDTTTSPAQAVAPPTSINGQTAKPATGPKAAGTAGNGANGKTPPGQAKKSQPQPAAAAAPAQSHGQATGNGNGNGQANGNGNGQGNGNSNSQANGNGQGNGPPAATPADPPAAPPAQSNAGGNGHK